MLMIRNNFILGVKCFFLGFCACLLAATIESKLIPGWLRLDKQKLTGEVLTLPNIDAIDAKFDGKTIVEFYSR